jgi:hypothetical protein
MTYTPFLGKFPKIKYKMDNTIYGDSETLTNLFFRVDLVKKTIDNASAYYTYILNEGDTPEILADKIYGDPGAFWMILYANDIFDPQFDWPLSEEGLIHYVAEKYRPVTQTASVKQVKIKNAGTGYKDGDAVVYDGHGSGASVSIKVDEYDGSILYANVEYSGSGYFMGDMVSCDVTSLRDYDGVDAELEVVLKDPDDADVLYYAKETIHHYEKVVTRVDSRNIDSPDQNRYIVSKDQLSNGVIYLANVSGEFSNADFAFVKDNVEPGGDTSNATFSGYVLEWNPTDTNPEFGTSNGWITLVVTKGDFVEYVDLKGNTTGAIGTIMHTSFNDPNYVLPNDSVAPFEYYNNLPETQAYESFNIEDYTVTEIYKRFAISIWDHENELNEKKRIIKIIKPMYHAKILNELEKILSAYKADGSVPVYSYKRRLF